MNIGTWIAVVITGLLIDWAIVIFLRKCVKGPSRRSMTADDITRSYTHKRPEPDTLPPHNRRSHENGSDNHSNSGTHILLRSLHRNVH